MASVQERLQLKRVPLDKWSISEQLYLASAVATSGDQNWMSVSRNMKMACGDSRPTEWFSQKSCAAQYEKLLENVGTTKRKKRSEKDTTPQVVETPIEMIVRKLTQDRIAELNEFLENNRNEYSTIQEDIAALENDTFTDEQLREMCDQIEEEEKQQELWTKEREQREIELETSWRPNITPLMQQTMASSSPQPIKIEEMEIIDDSNTKQATSPLLTSLLKSPSAAPNPSTSMLNTLPNQSRVTAPTITNLLTTGAVPSSPQPSTSSGIVYSSPIQNQPLTGPIPSEQFAGNLTPTPSQAAPTLSMLLESKQKESPTKMSAMQAMDGTSARAGDMNNPELAINNEDQQLMDAFGDLIPDDIDDLAGIILKDLISEERNEIVSSVAACSENEALEAAAAAAAEAASTAGVTLDESVTVKSEPSNLNENALDGMEFTSSIIDAVEGKIKADLDYGEKIDADEDSSDMSNDTPLSELIKQEASAKQQRLLQEQNEFDLQQYQQNDEEDQAAQQQQDQLQEQLDSQSGEQQLEQQPDAKTEVFDDLQKPQQPADQNDQSISPNDEAKSQQLDLNDQTSCDELVESKELTEAVDSAVSQDPLEQDDASKEAEIEADVKNEPENTESEPILEKTSESEAGAMRLGEGDEVMLDADNTAEMNQTDLSLVGDGESFAESEKDDDENGDVVGGSGGGGGESESTDDRESADAIKSDEIGNFAADDEKMNEEIVEKSSESDDEEGAPTAAIDDNKSSDLNEVDGEAGDVAVDTTQNDEILTDDETNDIPDENAESSGVVDVANNEEGLNEQATEDDKENETAAADATNEGNDEKGGLKDFIETDENDGNTEEAKEEAGEATEVADKHEQDTSEKPPTYDPKLSEATPAEAVNKSVSSGNESLNSTANTDSGSSEKSVFVTPESTDSSSKAEGSDESHTETKGPAPDVEQESSTEYGSVHQSSETRSTDEDLFEDAKENFDDLLEIKTEKVDEVEQVETNQQPEEEIVAGPSAMDRPPEVPTSKTSTPTPSITIDTDDDTPIEVIKENRSGRKRDYSRRRYDTNQSFDKSVDESVDDGGISSRLRMKDRDRSESPYVDEDFGEPLSKYKRRYSSTPIPDSLPNSPASSEDRDREYRGWKKAVMMVFNILNDHRYASIFAKPINEDHAPDYRDLILQPMDLQSIKRNIDSGNMRSTIDFKRSMMLMCHNAMFYNMHDTIICNRAKKMLDDAIEQIDEFNENWMKDKEKDKNTAATTSATKAVRGRKSNRLMN